MVTIDTEDKTEMNRIISESPEGEVIKLKLSGDIPSTGVGLAEATNIEIDLDGHELQLEKDDEGNYAGSSGTKTCGMQLLKDSNVTIKNGTIKAEDSKMLVQNYSNLTLENVKLLGSPTDTYVLSNNFGEVHLKGATEILATEGNVAFDLWYGMNSKGLYDDGVTVYIDDPEVVIQGPIEFGAANRATVANWLANTHLYVCKDYPNLEGLEIRGAGKGSSYEYTWVDNGDYYELKRTMDVE